jgi:methylmalonyl-CoA mutase
MSLMPSETDDLSLAREFAPSNRDEWTKLVDGVLKGGTFEKLVGRTYDGLRIEPLYSRATHAQVVAGRASTTPWQIMQRVDHPDANTASAQALIDLENGANGLTLVFAGAHDARGFGLEPSAAALDAALDGVYLDAGIDIEFQTDPQTWDMPQHFAQLLAKRHVQPTAVKVRFGFDPLGAAAVSGGSAFAAADLDKLFVPAVTKLTALGFQGPPVVADGRIVHDAGGSEAQELAFVLAGNVAYLRALEQASVALDDARRMIYVRLSADADQFMTLAKFRALRILWSHVEKSCGLIPQPLFIAADTAWRMLTRRDPYVNLLRSTIATFSAGLGGANSIAVMPHTLALGLPDPFARRIARNLQLILLEESNLAKVTDPAAGSGGIESLTTELCRSAWSMFQDIEKAGGVFAALEQNLIQDKISAARAARNKNIARRKEVLTGASEFPNLHEANVSVLDVKPIVPMASDQATMKFSPVSAYRLAEPFESLRDRSDHYLAAQGTRPKIFLSNIGTAADFTARASFAKSLFEAGGIEAIDTNGFSDMNALAAAFQKSGSSLACICSSDKMYEKLAAEAAKALQQVGAKYIYLAGQPGELEASLRTAGINEFAYAGADVVATLNAAYDHMGVS